MAGGIQYDQAAWIAGRHEPGAIFTAMDGRKYQSATENPNSLTGLEILGLPLWCIKFGSKYTKRLRRQHQGYGDTFYLDEVFVRIQGVQHYLWRAIDQDGEVVDVFLQRRRDGQAAKRFFKRLLRASGSEPRRIVTDKLRSYGVAHREIMPIRSMTHPNTPTIQRNYRISRRGSESEA